MSEAKKQVDSATRRASHCYAVVDEKYGVISLHWSESEAKQISDSGHTLISGYIGSVQKIRIEGAIPWRIEKLFCEHMGGEANQEVTRIEFGYMPEYADGVGDCPKCGPAPMKETIVDQDGIPQQVLCLVCKETAAPV